MDLICDIRKVVASISARDKGVTVLLCVMPNVGYGQILHFIHLTLSRRAILRASHFHSD